MNYLNKTFTTTVFAKTGDVFSGCTFTGGNTTDEAILMIGSANNVTVTGCTFKNLLGSGIAVRSSGSGCDNIQIINNRFENVVSQGVIAKNNLGTRNNTRVVISGNTFINCGQNTNGKTHAIYAFAPDIQVISNFIDTTQGNGISIRTSGVVRYNTVRNALKSAIRYFSDQPTGASKNLYIEGNVLTGSGVGYPVVSLLDGGVTSSQMVTNYYIRNNTITGNADTPWFLVESASFDPKHIEVYDNRLISGIAANLKYVDVTTAPA